MSLLGGAASQGRGGSGTRDPVILCGKHVESGDFALRLT